MDPTQALRDALAAARLIIDDTEEHDGSDRLDAAEDLAAHVIALSDWITRGGFLPAQWEPGADAPIGAATTRNGCQLIAMPTRSGAAVRTTAHLPNGRTTGIHDLTPDQADEHARNLRAAAGQARRLAIIHAAHQAETEATR